MNKLNTFIIIQATGNMPRSKESNRIKRNRRAKERKRAGRLFKLNRMNDIQKNKDINDNIQKNKNTNDTIDVSKLKKVCIAPSMSRCNAIQIYYLTEFGKITTKDTYYTKLLMQHTTFSQDIADLIVGFSHISLEHGNIIECRDLIRVPDNVRICCDKCFKISTPTDRQHAPICCEGGNYDLKVHCVDYETQRSIVWRECRIRSIDPERFPNCIQVHYIGWGDKWDEWIELDSGRIADLGTFIENREIKNRCECPKCY